MALFTIEGTITNITPVEHRGAKQFPVRAFVVEETEGQYTNSYCFSLLGEKTDMIEKYRINQKVQVKFAPSSREHNGRWYTELKAVFISDSSGHQPQPTQGTHSTPPPIPPPTGQAQPAYQAPPTKQDGFKPA